jgi:hypothetical protein
MARVTTRLCWRTATGHTVTAANSVTSNVRRLAGEDHPDLPPTEWSSAEFTLAWHLARAVEDLLPVAPPGLALTETMEVLLC